MRNLKKFLALVLAMMMAMSLMITANAANEADNATSKYPDGDSVTTQFVEAVDVLSGMKVFKGRDTGDFAPADTITRAETAAIIYRLMTADVTDAQADLFRNVTHPFTDVKPSDWYAGYIGFLWNAGIIKGQTATTFNPYGKVTGYEALAMILRAVGYDQNHEFEGTNWVVNVASIAQRKGILKDVESANYGGPYLYSAARRDVVASLLFRTAAFVPQVIYTNAFQYTETGMTGGPTGAIVNPSLGYQNFGLVYAHGVVVGNQTTGETSTRITFAEAPRAIAGTNGTDTAMTTVNFASYLYEIVRYQGASGEVVSRSDSFNWETDLRLFNHAVRVWFDHRDGANKDTYAMYDRATNVAVVMADDADLTADTGNLYNKATATGDSIANNWKGPGFTVNQGLGYAFRAADGLTPADPDAPNAGDKWVPVGQQDGAFFNWSFTRMVPQSWVTNGSATSHEFGESPIMKNDSTEEWNLYLLISNSDNKNLDVVIPLDLTFTQITQRNTTTGKASVGVITENGATGTPYFDTFDQVNPAVGADYSSIAVANLKNSPKTDLGTKVAAITITGTNGSRNNNVDRAAANTNTVDFGFATKGAGLKTAINTAAGTNATTESTYYYQLTENTRKVTATVWKVDAANQDVYLSDGTVLKQSIYAEATDGSFINGAAHNNLDGMEAYDATAGIFRLKANADAYTFTLDEQGHYIYWETPSNSSDFVYGTYIDFQTAVASSLFDYPMVYVNANGEGKQQVNVTSVYENDGTTPADGATTAAMDNESYDSIVLPKRDATAGGNNSGYVKGLYVGYAKSSDGKLVEVGPTVATSQDTGFLQGDATHFGAAEIVIDSRSVNVGAEPTDFANMFLTNNTKFVIVSGAGTANQTVVIKNGIEDLMKGMDSVKINGNGKTPYSDKGFIDFASGAYTNMAEMFYYEKGDFKYDQNYDPSAEEIKTLILPADCIQFNASSTSTLVFVGNSDSKIINANNGKWATLYTVYQNGESKQVWIQGHYATAGDDAYKVNQNKDNVFYNLVETSDKAADGNVIYKIASVSDDTKLLGRYWNVDGVTEAVKAKGDIDSNGADQGTATIANATPLLYMATTFNQQAGYINTDDTGPDTLYNVGNAKITNLNTTAYPGIENNNLSSLNGASSLTNNIGVPVSCVLSADYVVSVVYVNANVNP